MTSNAEVYKMLGIVPGSKADADYRPADMWMSKAEALLDQDDAADGRFHRAHDDLLQQHKMFETMISHYQRQVDSLNVELDELHLQMDKLRSRIDSKSKQIAQHDLDIKSCRQDANNILARIKQQCTAHDQQINARVIGINGAVAKAKVIHDAMHRTQDILRASSNKRPREEALSQQTTGQHPSELPRDPDRSMKRLRVPKSLSPSPWNQLSSQRVSTKDNSGPSQSQAITSSPSKTLSAPGSTEKSPGPSQPTADGSTPRTGSFVPRAMTRNERRQLAKASKLAQSNRTIFFEDVFKRGEPRHQIINHPPGSASFWILECTEHRIQFGSEALVMATQHACGPAHGEIHATPSRMVNKFGKLVWYCNAEKAVVNNGMCAELEAKALQKMKQNEARKVQDGSQHDAMEASEPKQGVSGHVWVKSEESDDPIVVSSAM